MKVKTIAEPITPPFDLESIKGYLKVLDDDQDGQIETMAKANISRAEDITNLVLAGVTEFELTLDCFQDFRFPVNPLIEVKKVEYKDTDGSLQILNKGKYHADSSVTPATMEFYQVPSTTEARITFKAGFEILEAKVALWLNVKVYEDFYNLPDAERSKHIDSYLDSLRIIPI